MIKMNGVRTVMLFILIMFSFISYSQDFHIGLWKGVDKGGVGYINFDKEGFVFLIIEGDTVGGREFEEEGIKAKLIYEINYKYNPHHLDFIAIQLDNDEELGRLLGIMEIIDENSMKVKLNFEKPLRPTDFEQEDKNNMVMLKRVN